MVDVAETSDTAKRSRKWPYLMGALSIVFTALVVFTIIYFRGQIQELKTYGYLGAFIISILTGATVIIPIPGIAIIFALGSTMSEPWQAALLALAAALGELIGSITIYMTGHGAGRVIRMSKHGKIQTAYEKMLQIMERRGPIFLFVMATVINPFFYPAALAAGALRFGLKGYVIFTFAGKFVKFLITVYIGYYGIQGILRAIGLA